MHDDLKAKKPIHVRILAMFLIAYFVITPLYEFVDAFREIPPGMGWNCLSL